MENYELEKLEELLNEKINRVHSDIKEANKKVDRLIKIIIGNGNAGILERVTCNSTNIKVLMWLLVLLIGLITGLNLYG